MLSVWSVCAASEPERQQREKTARHPGQDGVPTVTEQNRTLRAALGTA